MGSMKTRLTAYQDWCSNGLFALKALFFGQNHHNLDHLDVIFNDPCYSDVKSYFNEYILAVSRNRLFHNLIFSTYPCLTGPACIPLSEMRRSAGPERDKPNYIPKILFEIAVQYKVKEIRRGWKPPPIIAIFEIRQGHPHLYIGDGTHRYEALRRIGYREYYAIICYHPPNETDLNRHLTSIASRREIR